MADVISDFLTNYGPQILNAGAQYLVGQDSASRANALLTAYGTTTADASKALMEGYGAQLESTEAIAPEVNRLLDEYDSDTVGAVNRLGTENAELVDRYGANRYSTLGNAQAEYTAGAGNYAGTLTGGYDAATPYLLAGYEGMQDALQPYVASGDQARGYLEQTMGQDPNQLTPSQKIMFDKYHRDVIGQVNGSGIRGAGRAGVAAVNEGLADIYAKTYDQNLARSDAAAGTLSQQGYGATGAIGTGKKELGGALSDMTYGTGAKLADNEQRLGDIKGELAYTTGKDTADNELTYGTKTADIGFQKSNDMAKNRLDTGTSLASNLTKARADTAMGVAQAKAAALNNQAITDAQKTSIKNYTKGDTFQSIKDIFAGAKPAVT